jgi:hypothetical protein
MYSLRPNLAALANGVFGVGEGEGAAKLIILRGHSVGAALL